MAGLSSIRSYVPNAGSGAGARPDEDALTLAVEAVLACLTDVEPLTLGGLYFASASAPFEGSQVASAVATACDLPRDIVTADFTGSDRSGLAALSAAVRAVEGGIRKVVVVASDRGRPGVGDGAAAVVVDRQGRWARYEASVAVAEDLSFQMGAVLPGAERQPLRDLAEVIERVANEHGVGPDEVAGLALGRTDRETAHRVAELVGIGAERCHAAPQRGGLGAAEPFLRLSQALSRASAGQPVVVAAEGQGAEAMLLVAGEEKPVAEPPSAPFATPVAPWGPRVWAPPSRGVHEGVVREEVDRRTRLYGSRCGACQDVQYPAVSTCPACGATSGLEPAKLAKTGRCSSTLESGLVRVELESGGEIELPPTDDVSEIAPDALVRLALRRSTAGPLRYVWKVRPA